MIDLDDISLFTHFLFLLSNDHQHHVHVAVYSRYCTHLWEQLRQCAKMVIGSSAPRICIL